MIFLLVNFDLILKLILHLCRQCVTSTDNKNNQKTDTFEFFDGLHQASKGRIILYLAGDLFTAGLAELVFWPLEANAFDGKQCKGTVSYGVDDRVSNYDILDSKGLPLWNQKIAATPVTK